MARQPTNKANPDLERALRSGGLEDEKTDAAPKQPSYQVIGDSRVPVSKSHGAVWKSRRDAGCKRYDNYHEAWKEAVAYYMNTSDEDRDDTGGRVSRSIGVQRKLTDAFCEVENIVFANTTALVPLTYSKNPTIEVTATSNTNTQLARVCEKLGNALITRRADPCVKLKDKARRGVVLALLTSRAYIEAGWTKKDASSAQAIEDLQKLADELKKAKDVKTILEIEGKLEALEQNFDLLRNEGPFTRLRLPWEIVIDPACQEDDLSDARWVMIADMIPTAFIRARYAKRSEDGTYKSIYKPTHVMNLKEGAGSPMDDQVASFSILGASDGDSVQDNRHMDYGFEDKDAFDNAQYTKVWKVWDKTTRRMLMFNDKEWSWPIWVWDDPYGLDKFFPLAPLNFQVSPVGGPMKGEVSYYLDQQDAVNEINSERRRARRWAARNIVYNSKRIDQEQADRLLRGDRDTALGITLNEGEKIKDIIDSLTPPSMNFIDLFRTETQMQAVDRISSVSDILRGAQFKTNTTNDAVDTYNSVAQTRQDEKIDLVEDWIGDVMWMILQMALQFMDAATVSEIIGQDKSVGWTNLPPEQMASSLSLRVVGGSVVKPTGAAKKRQALEVGQILGQFASASPVAFLVAAKVFEKAFDEVVITAEDWQLIQQAIEAQLQGSGGGEGQALDELAQQIDALPPEAKQAIGTAIARGAPVARVLEQVLGASEQPQQGANGNADRVQ